MYVISRSRGKAGDRQASLAEAASPRPDWAIRLTLLAIVAVALALRGVVIALLPGSIDSEGTEYARLAENILSGVGYVGLSQEGPQLLFPPLFPLLIAAASWLTGDVETAGRLITMIAGGLTPLPIYFVAAKLYGHRAGLLAAAIAAFHPWLVYMPAPMFGETLYMALIMAATCFLMAAIEDARPRHLIGGGVFYGLAYLVRPEAVAYMALAAIILALGLWWKRRPDAPAGFARIGLLVLPFIILAAPYVVWLSSHADHFRIEGKSPLNIATELRMQQGEPVYSTYFSVDAGGREKGVWNQPHIETIRSHSLTAGEKLSFLLAKAKTVVTHAIDRLVAGRVFGSPLLFAVAAIGVFARPWGPLLALHQVHLFGMLGLAIVGTFFIYYNDWRFYIVPLALLTVWAAGGLQQLARWGRATGRALGLKARWGPAFGSAVVGLAVVMLLALPAVAMKPMIERALADRAVKTAGEWLRDNTEGPIRILDLYMMKSFHAGAIHVWLPYTDEATALRYIERKGITHVVVRTTDSGAVPYLEKWIRSGIPLPHAKLVYSFDRMPGETVKIYAVGPPRRADAGLDQHIRH